MPDLFPPALIDCVKSGVPPTREQLGSVASHVWRDWCRGFGITCTDLPRDPRVAEFIRSVAWLAMTGDAHGMRKRQRDPAASPVNGHQALDTVC